MSLIIRSNTTRILNAGPKGLGAINMPANTAVTIPENKINMDLLARLRTLSASGDIEILDSEPAHGLNMQRPSTARDQLHIILGTGATGSVVLPNGSTLHVLTIGGVAFTLGNSNIDGADVAALTTALVTALNDSTDFAATGATVAASTILAGDEKSLIIIDADNVADWTAFKAATSLKDTEGADLGSPALTITTFDSSAEDTALSTVPVLVTRTANSADVTRGYIALDTGLTSVPSYALSITRSGSRVLHNGTVTLESNRVLIIENDSTTDFANGDVLTLAAFGND